MDGLSKLDPACLILTDVDLVPRANLMPLAEIGLYDLRDDILHKAENCQSVILRRGDVCKMLKSPDMDADMTGDQRQVFMCQTGKSVSKGLLRESGQ